MAGDRKTGTLYRERLAVPLWWWPAAAVIVAVLGGELHLPGSLAWSVGSYSGVALVVAVLLLGLGRSRLSVTADGRFRAGSEVIPVSALGPALVRRGEDLRLRLGPYGDPTAFLLIRPWVRTVVEMAVVDPDDGRPYWIVSTRRPDQLIAALAETQAPTAKAPAAGEAADPADRPGAAESTRRAEPTGPTAPAVPGSAAVDG